MLNIIIQNILGVCTRILYDQLEYILSSLQDSEIAGKECLPVSFHRETRDCSEEENRGRKFWEIPSMVAVEFVRSLASFMIPKF